MIRAKSSVWTLICILCTWTIKKFVSSEENYYCYMKDEEPYVYFGTRTAYENVAGSISHFPGCGVVFMWGLLRHGTRFGSAQYGKTTRNITRIKNEIIENHEIYKRGKLCTEDLQNLKKWTYNWSEIMDYELTQQGEKDMKNLGKRLRATFPSFQALSKDDFTFTTTSKSRCKNSSIAFTNGLLNNSISSLEGNGISINDTFLRILVNKPTENQILEVALFKQTDVVQKMLNEVGIRLGYEQNLTYGFVKDLYTHCAYENAWLPHSRPGFCAAFTKEHLKVLEFAADLEDYYVQGYGDKNNSNRSCSILEDLLVKLTSAKNCLDEQRKGAFYIAHSETLLPTFVQLDLFNDNQWLRHDSYEMWGSKRKWRTSFMDSFASNLIVILYRCLGKFKIVFYVSENQFSVPGCAAESCSMNSFEDLFTNKILKRCPRSRGSTVSAATLSILCVGFIFFNNLQMI